MVTEGKTDTKILSPENIPMFTAVAFIIAIIGLAFSLVSYARVKQATVGLAVLQVAKARGDKKVEARQDARMDMLEKRLASVETGAADKAEQPPADESASAAAAAAQ